MTDQFDAQAALAFFKAKMDLASVNLSQASIHMAALEQRGPIIAPDLQEWRNYVQELEDEFHRWFRMLSNFLIAIQWSGPEMPRRQADWDKWWNSVRVRGP